MLRRTLVVAPLLALFSVALAQVPHNYDLLDVNWSVSFDEKQGTITGGVTNTIEPTADNVSQVAFHEGKLKIESITVDGASAHWSVNGENLLVDLPTPA